MLSINTIIELYDDSQSLEARAHGYGLRSRIRSASLFSPVSFKDQTTRAVNLEGGGGKRRSRCLAAATTNVGAGMPMSGFIRSANPIPARSVKGRGGTREVRSGQQPYAFNNMKQNWFLSRLTILSASN